jgi:enoyl-CoA hydratase/carnithine racemase
MDDSLVITKQDGHCAWLTLNQPKSRNPLSSQMIAALSAALATAYDDAQTRVIVLAAEGPVFSAGHDLKEMQKTAGESDAAFDARVKQLLADCARMMMGIVHAPKPVIACVQGTASAAGCQLVSVCDLAIAADDASFCLPGVNIGIFCTTPLVGVGRNLSRKHAMEMALTGDMFAAAQAQEFGLINRHVPGQKLSQEVKQLAYKIASRSAQGIRAGKAAFYQQIDMPLAQSFAFANEAMACAVTSEGDAEEGRQAFIDKRPPKWGDA